MIIKEVEEKPRLGQLIILSNFVIIFNLKNNNQRDAKNEI